MPTKHIVKIQVSLSGGLESLIYNKDRSIEFQAVLPSNIAKQMEGEFKKFFHALYYEKIQNLEILGVAPGQEW